MNTTDTPPLTFQPRKPIRYRPRPAGPPAAAPAAPPVLVSAVCDESPSLTLAFDRPIDVAGVDVTLFRVDVAPLGFTYVGYETPIVVSPTTVQILLTGIEEYAGAGVILTAAAGNGIVAVDDGGVWAGVVDLSLPYP